ncbi:hypothetical protein DUNSADRAFT_12004, partial [Dunaliella salina]
MESLMSAGSVLQRNSPAGTSTFATSRRVNLGVSRNTRRDTARAIIDNFGVNVLNRDDVVDAGAYMPNAGAEFAKWCQEDPVCSTR